jgi:hypothetical protein
MAKDSRNYPEIHTRSPHGTACMSSAPFVTVDLRDEPVRCRRAAHGEAEPFIANQNLEKWMKLVKTSLVALAMSAVLAGPVLAQGTSSDSKIRGGAQGKTQMQGGISGSGDEEFNAQAGAAGEKVGVNGKAGAKGTVGAGSGAAKATGGAAGDAATGKRY